MQLPYLTDLSQMATKWRSILNPFLSNPSLQSVILPNIVLVEGANIINHTLGRVLTGWRPVRVRASATLYDTQDSNPTPDLTLMLTASAGVTLDLEVF